MLEQDFEAALMARTPRARITPHGPARLISSEGDEIAQLSGTAPDAEVTARPLAAAPVQIPNWSNPAEPARTSGVAIAAFLCSLVGLWIAGIPLGVHAQRGIDGSNGRLTGRGFATAGIVLGILGIVGTVILIVAVIHAGQNAASTPGCTLTYNATGGCVPGT